MQILQTLIVTAFCLSLFFGCRSYELSHVRLNGTIPLVFQGLWYSWENGRSTTIEIRQTSMSDRGECVQMMKHSHVNYTFVFLRSDDDGDDLYTCVKLMVRSINVLDKMEGVCKDSLPFFHQSKFKLFEFYDTQINTLFAYNYTPQDCQSSLEGAWQFSNEANMNRFRFTCECDNPGTQIKHCETERTQFSTNDKFYITYKKCPGMNGTFDSVIEYSCLGDWPVGKNHFFAVVNSKETQKDKKYRCFLRHWVNASTLGVSITTNCNTLQTLETISEGLHLNSAARLKPKCQLHKTFIGEWVNTANMNANVTINGTHIVETWITDKAEFRSVIYVCHEHHHEFSKNHYVMELLDGMKKDKVCFFILPRHDNIIRYHKGEPCNKGICTHLCPWYMSSDSFVWKFDTLISKTPDPIRCPVTGKFYFTHRGDTLFGTSDLDEVTPSPHTQLKCNGTVSNLAVCSGDQKEITVRVTFCSDGSYVNHYRYQFQCIGYWMEYAKSYLVTYDPLDAASMYRCWVYQQTDNGHILMSQSIGSSCGRNQNALSNNRKEGATVAINMTTYNHQSDNCPMHFDNGDNPWSHSIF